MIKCTVHYIVHLQFTFSFSRTYESKKFSRFSLILKRRLSNGKIQCLYCTISCTVSRDDRAIKIILFHQSAAQATKKKILLSHVLQRKSYVRTCIEKILFVKKYLNLLWVFTDFSILLFRFLNINTAITQQLIRTARTLEAEWWQVCGEAWVRGQRKMSQVLGAFGLLDFATLRPFLSWRGF